MMVANAGSRGSDKSMFARSSTSDEHEYCPQHQELSIIQDLIKVIRADLGSALDRVEYIEDRTRKNDHIGGKSRLFETPVSEVFRDALTLLEKELQILHEEMSEIKIAEDDKDFSLNTSRKRSPFKRISKVKKIIETQVSAVIGGAESLESAAGKRNKRLIRKFETPICEDMEDTLEYIFVKLDHLRDLMSVLFIKYVSISTQIIIIKN